MGKNPYNRYASSGGSKKKICCLLCVGVIGVFLIAMYVPGALGIWDGTFNSKEGFDFEIENGKVTLFRYRFVSGNSLVTATVTVPGGSLASVTLGSFSFSVSGLDVSGSVSNGQITGEVVVTSQSNFVPKTISYTAVKNTTA